MFTAIISFLTIYGVASPVLASLLLVLGIKYTLSHIEEYRFRNAHGCHRVPQYPQPERILGYHLFSAIKTSFIEKRSLEAGLERSLSVGSTYSATSLGQAFLITTDPENIKTVLATKFGDYGVGARLDAFGPLLGRGIFTADGSHWEHSRSLVRPSFSKAQLTNFSALENHVQDLIARVPKDGSTVDLQPLFFNQTLDSATEFLFGEACHSQTSSAHSEAQRFSEAFDYAQLEVQRRLQLGRLRVFYHNPRFFEACRIVHEFAENYIKKAINYREQLDAHLGEQQEVGGRYVFLNELSKTTLDSTVLRDEMLNILLAGRDTTAGLLSHTFHALARHAKVWHALKKEVDELNGKLPTYDTLKNMPYLKCVINEVLRLWPSVPSNSRFANKDTVLPRGGGRDRKSPVYVPKGAVIVYSVYAMHRRKDVYGPDADQFIPERWLKTAGKDPLRPGWGYLPFNGGPRICLGQQFALAEASYTIVRLLQTFEAIESRDSMPWTEHLGVTLCSANGTKVALFPPGDLIEVNRRGPC